MALLRMAAALAALVWLSAGVQAADMNQYFVDKDATGRWTIPTGNEPVAGTQNFWFVTPYDVRPGAYMITPQKGKLTNLTADGLDVVYNCVWGDYQLHVTRLDVPKELGSAGDVPNWASVGSSHLKWAELGAAGDRAVLNGKITEVAEDHKSFTGELDLAGGAVPVRFDLVKVEKEKPRPQIQSRLYGPHWHQTFDVYYPAGFTPGQDKPLPVLMQIHGGGWGALDKGPYNAKPWNDAGIAVISVDYRFVSEFRQEPATTVPVAAPLLDAARALQYVRYHAKDLGIDPARICLTGGSAGGATDCWLAMHDDLAEPDSPDPIARMSTRVLCAAPVQAQTSLDPQQMREWIPQITYGGHAFLTSYPKDVGNDREKRFAYWLSQREKLLPLIHEFSPYAWASKDDPPMLLVYGGRKNVLPAPTDGDATHHPQFGIQLNKRLRELGVQSDFYCEDVKAENPRYNGWQGMANFVKDHLLGPDWDKKQ